MGKRLPRFAYGFFGCAVLFATCLYAVGFVGNLLVPQTIDGSPVGGIVAGVAVDLALLIAFDVPGLIPFTRGPGERGVLGRRRASRAAQ
jgi:methanethiol S-methyltransferase